jgi:hypothetical protein
LTDALHEPPAGQFAPWRQQEMYMVCHQAVRMQSAARTAKESFQVEKIKAAIFIRNKTGIAIVATLDNMQRTAGND